MRILWLSPIGAQSAIGRFSTFVVEELVKLGHDVLVASSEWKPPEEIHRFIARSLVSVAELLALHNLDDFDVIIANYGDHFPNHVGSLHALDHPRLIGIFHDADMTNLGNGIAAFGSDVSPKLPSLRINKDHVTSSIAERCAGAVAHSPYYAPSVDACDGPVGVIPLAWAIKAPLAPSPSPSPSPSDERLRLVTIGNINRNKCADRVIEAIGGSKTLRSSIDYRLVGAIEDKERNYLCSLAEAKDVALTILGPVDDETLVGEIANARIISCLREPVLEGASASAIECMLHGKAVMVSNAGFYRELPEDCVIRVPAKTLPEDIRQALEHMADRPDLCDAIANRARDFATAVFSPKRYALDLMNLIEEVRAVSAYRPTQQRLAAQLMDLGLSPSSPAVAYLVDALEKMIPIHRRDRPEIAATDSAP